MQLFIKHLVHVFRVWTRHAEMKSLSLWGAGLLKEEVDK